MYRGRQRQTLFVYALILLAAAAFELGGTPSGGASAALLGLTFPGAGFLHWASGDQAVLAFGLFIGSLALFAVAILLWFATGNILAPAAIWLGLAIVAGRSWPFGITVLQEGGRDWPWLIGPVLLSIAIVGWCRLGRPAPREIASITAHAIPLRSPGAVSGDLPEDDIKRLRLLLDRALQPVERFDGFERRDQFQTAALRYQVNFMAYALAFARERHVPAVQPCLVEAQERLLTKIGDRRLWSYWKLENAWGNLRIGSDPIARQNIMYSGFTALQMALGGGQTLQLHASGKVLHSHELGDLADLLTTQYRSSPYGLLECEPNWIYPLCNLITMAGIKAADARLGTDRWQRLSKPFLEALQREAMRADGSFIAFRSSLTGFAPPAAGGIVMQAFPCLFLNALSPELAQQQWGRVRRSLDHGSWRRLFWPVDVGNYGFSRASSYAATAAAAVEMGDREIADECLRLLEQECPSRESGGAIHRDKASLWAHALELIARCNRADGLRALTARGCAPGGPYLASEPDPQISVTQGRPFARGLDLIVDPRRPDLCPLLIFGGLLPERHYRTGLAQQPFVKSDREGRALLRVALSEPTRITLAPIV